MTIEAAPIVVDPSGEFLGADGAWSTFSISVGSPPQQLQVLASTEVTSTWVVAPEGCRQKDAAANCTEARGGVYDGTKSSSWNRKDLYRVEDESNLGYEGEEYLGTYGYDMIEIQAKGANVSIDHQVIAAIEAKKFYVGNLGLSPYPINFTTSEDSSPSLLASLKNQNLIPSLSYGYTAGASYRQNNGAPGSLTLGGYDASRLIPNDLSFNFAPTEKRQLLVGLQSITHSTSKAEKSLLSDGVLALVDSTVPYLWLPQVVCDAFVDAFGLSWDGISNLYLVNDTLHETLLKENASVIFQLANGPNGGPSINITLPYASFDLEASPPLIKSQSRYFPLQRANDDDAVTLGRTFFQEAFLVVDYEHSNFSISQAAFDTSAPSHIISLVSNTTANGLAANPTSGNGTVYKTTQSSGSHGIGTGAIAGIAIAILLMASLCGAFFIYRCLQRRKRNNLNKDPIGIEASKAKAAPEDDDDSKHDFSGDLEVKKPVAPTVTVNETQSPMTPPSEVKGDYFFTGSEKERAQSNTFELPGSPPNRSELSTPEPWPQELPSPDLGAVRSELSTPEPSYNHPELPSPDPSHELGSPSFSSVSSGQPSPALHDNRRSALHSPVELAFQRPFSERMDSSESEAGWTRDGMPHRPFHRRYQSDDSLNPSSQSRPLSSRMDTSDSEGWIRPTRVDESSEFEPTVSPITTRRNPTHLDSSDSEAAISAPSAASQSSRQRPAAVSADSSSDSEAPSPRPSPSRQIRGLTMPFYSSSSSRPGIRRSMHAFTRPSTFRTDSSDSDAWQTRLDSASTENPSDVSRFPSVRYSRGVESGMPDVRDKSLSEESEEREEGGRR